MKKTISAYILFSTLTLSNNLHSMLMPLRTVFCKTQKYSPCKRAYLKAWGPCGYENDSVARELDTENIFSEKKILRNIIQIHLLRKQNKIVEKKIRSNNRHISFIISSKPFNTTDLVKNTYLDKKLRYLEDELISPSSE